MTINTSGSALLRWRLSLILVAITLAMMAAVATFVGRQVEQALLGTANAHVAEENRLVRDMISAYYRSLLRSAQDLSASFTHRVSGPYALREAPGKPPLLYAGSQVLNDATGVVDSFTYDTRGHAAAVLVRDAEGFQVVASSLRREDGSRDLSFRIARDHRDFARLAEGQPLTGRFQIGRRHSMLHVEPVRSDDGAVIGALAVAMDLEEPLAVLRNMIRTVKIGATGYSYVLDATPGPDYGRVVVHPAREGSVILGAKDADGRDFIREILTKKQGLIRYPWINEALGEKAPRDKIVAYDYVPELEWVVGSGSYVDEFLGIADSVRRSLVLATALVAAALILALNLAIGRWVIAPLLHLQARLKESEARWNFAVEGSGDGVWDWRLDTGELYVSARWREMLGYAPDTLAATAAERESLIHPEDLPAVKARVARHLDGQSPHYLSEHRVRHSDGHYLWVLERGKVVAFGPQGKALRLIGTQADITQRKQAEEERRLWANIFADSTEGIVITDAANRIVSANRAFERITGYPLAELVGHHPGRFNAGRQDDAFYASIADSLDATGRWQGEIWNRHKDGSEYPAALFITTVRDADGQVVNRVGILSDISERKAAQAQVEYLAHHDVLTGLDNRAGLHQRLDTLFARHAEPSLALIAIGIDRLKDVNESLGHQAGDEVLRTVAGRLQQHLRVSDFLARPNGDEFVAVVLDPGTTDSVRRIADTLAAAIAEPCRVADMDLRVTASMGVSLCPHDSRQADALLRDAEAAMHAAKEQGRGKICFFTRDLNERTSERLLMENQLRQALPRSELSLVYQPQVHLQTGQLLGVEALLRWQGPAGAVSPGRFIPLAEQTQLIIPIGEWVLREACRQQQAWRRAGLPVIAVAVNISAVQFHQPEFLGMVERIVGEFGVTPGMIELEVTESVLMHDASKAIGVFQRLKELGFGLAIDDFGTGYSSMSYLRHFPVDRLKIDQSFVRGTDNRLAEDAIVRTIIALGDNLDLRVIAEGVETAEQAARLREHGCHEAQGYHFGRPMRADDFERWFAALIAVAQDNAA